MKKIYLSTALIMSVFAGNTQSTIVGNTINGYVWQEKGTADGTYDDLEESMLPGIVVELYVLSGSSAVSLVSAAITDQNGSFALPNNHGTGSFYMQYRYPDKGLEPTIKRFGTDNAINSAADAYGFTDVFEITDLEEDISNLNMGLKNLPNKRTYCTVRPEAIPSWSSNLKLPKFNEGGSSNLTKVDLFAASLAYHPVISIENTSGASSSANIAVGAQLTVGAPGISTYSTLTSVNEVTSLPPFDGTIDFSGASAFTWRDKYGVFVENSKVVTAPFLLNNYKGADSISIDVNAQSATTFIGGGSFEYSVSTFATASVCVVYEYTGIPLPVTFYAFDAFANENSTASIHWITTDEEMNSGFYIERSFDGNIFEDVGFVASQTLGSNNQNLNNYSFIDYNPTLTNDNFYRLRQVDLDGTTKTYTAVKTVSFKNHYSPINIYPNPLNRSNLTVDNLYGIYEISILDYTGAIIKSLTSNGSKNIEINLENVPNGNYIMQVISTRDNQKEVKPFIIKR